MEDILFLCSAQEEIERNFRQENYKIIWVISIFHGSFKNIITWKLFKNQRIFFKNWRWNEWFNGVRICFKFLGQDKGVGEKKKY